MHFCVEGRPGAALPRVQERRIRCTRNRVKILDTVEVREPELVEMKPVGELPGANPSRGRGGGIEGVDIRSEPLDHREAERNVKAYSEGVYHAPIRQAIWADREAPVEPPMRSRRHFTWTWCHGSAPLSRL